QHYPPTLEIIEGLKSTGKRVVVLLREPNAGMLSYKKLNNGNYKESLADLEKFNKEYRKLEGVENVLIITYEDLVENTSTVITRVLNHLRLPVPQDINTVKLSKMRTASCVWVEVEGAKDYPT
ncbi:unnamed protein product, partial [marine sediment metagenome]